MSTPESIDADVRDKARQIVVEHHGIDIPGTLQDRCMEMVIEAIQSERDAKWQPIETADNEGQGYFYSGVLIGFTTWGKEGRVHKHVGPIEWMFDHWEFIGTDFDVFPAPTHWAHWPSPPHHETQRESART